MALQRILVGDRFGRPLADLRAEVGPTSWVLTGLGRSSITLSTSDAKAIEENLRIGNRLYLEFDNGLPAWGGVLDLPRAWKDGTVTVSAYTIERLLEYRCTRKNDSFYERPAGAIFRQLLRREEIQDPMGITFGEVWTGGRSHYPRYHYKSLWYVLDYSLRRLERCEWLFVPILQNNRIRFEANFYQQAGSDRTQDTAVVEGRNAAEGLSLTEQGGVVNTHFAVAEGATWGPDRQVVVARDNESAALYGLRETGKVYPGVSTQATLEMHATNTLNTHGAPRRIFTFDVTDHEPGLFAAYDIGDRITCQLPSFGFSGYDDVIRIKAREYNPMTGECSLVVEEPRDQPYWIYEDEAAEESQ